MTLQQFLAGLAERQVTFFLDGDRLRYRAPEGALTAQLRAVIGEHRAEIINHLRGNLENTREPGKCVVCDRRHWVDDPPRDGRIRTTCAKCMRFIGYRPMRL